jgi:hypothetical protein
MAGSLAGPLAKWTRAQTQLNELSREVFGVFPRNKLWPVRTEADRSGLEYRFYLGDLPGVEPDWAFKTGEIMFNLRASLDYLVYELHLRRYRGKLPPKIEKLPLFPIYNSRGEFSERRIAKLSQRDRRAIRHLQPYVRRQDEWFNARYWLGRLNALHNVDKHRKLHLVTASLTTAPFPKMDPAHGFESDPAWGPVEPQAQVDHWTFAKAPPDIQSHPGMHVDISLEYEGEWVELIRFGRTTLIGVREVLKRFEDRFGR